MEACACCTSPTQPQLRAARCQLEGQCQKTSAGDEACTGLEPTSQLLPHCASQAFSKSPALDLLRTGHRDPRAQENQGPERLHHIFWWPHHCLFAGPRINSHDWDEIIWTLKMLSLDNLFSKGLFTVRGELRLERELAPCLRVLSALPEDLDLVASTYILQLPSGDPAPSSGIQVLVVYLHKPTHKYTCTHVIRSKYTS